MGADVKDEWGIWVMRGVVDGSAGYAARQRVVAWRVVFVDPAYTSQTCSRCGHAAQSNRPSQAVFRCGACGFRAHADHNAAIHIPARAGLPHVPVQHPGSWGLRTARSVPSLAGHKAGQRDSRDP